jgi:hypothetical protein
VWGTEVKGGTTSLYTRLAQWDDNITWGMMLDENIVWGMDDNIVWGAFDSVMAFSELLIGMTYEDAVDSQSIMTEGEVR